MPSNRVRLSSWEEQLFESVRQLRRAVAVQFPSMTSIEVGFGFVVRTEGPLVTLHAGWALRGPARLPDHVKDQLKQLTEEIGLPPTPSALEALHRMRVITLLFGNPFLVDGIPVPVFFGDVMDQLSFVIDPATSSMDDLMGDHVEVFLDFARANQEQEFKELARMALPRLTPEEIELMWTGTKTRIRQEPKKEKT